MSESDSAYMQLNPREKLMVDLKMYAIIGGVMIGIPCIPFLGAYFVNKNTKPYAKLYEQAAIVVDINNDGVATKEEWISAYSKAGILNDIVDPKNLNRSQLEKVIEANK